MIPFQLFSCICWKQEKIFVASCFLSSFSPPLPWRNPHPVILQIRPSTAFFLFYFLPMFCHRLLSPTSAKSQYEYKLDLWPQLHTLLQLIRLFQNQVMILSKLTWQDRAATELHARAVWHIIRTLWARLPLLVHRKFPSVSRRSVVADKVLCAPFSLHVCDVTAPDLVGGGQNQLRVVANILVIFSWSFTVIKRS